MPPFSILTLLGIRQGPTLASHRKGRAHLLFVFMGLLVPLALLGGQAALASAPATQPQGEDGAEDDAPEPEATVETFFDVEALIPGKRAHLVIAVKVPKDWHIYWETPGETGMATSWELSGPKGWVIDEPLFPGPRLYRDAQGFQSHILEGEVGFFVPIIPPKDATPGTTATIQIKGRWLMCKEICLMGSFEGEAQIEVQTGQPKRVNARRLIDLRKQIPKSIEAARPIGMSFGGKPQLSTLSFSSRDDRHFDFFPSQASPMVLAESKGRGKAVQQVSFSQRNFQLVPGFGEKVEEIEVQGVLRCQVKDVVTYYSVRLEGPMVREPAQQALGHGSLPTIPKDHKK